MFFPIPILLYILEIGLVFGIKGKLSKKKRAVIAAILVILTAALAQWLIVTD